MTVLPDCCEEGPTFEITRETLEDIDYIVSATGSKFGVEGLPFLRELNKDYPIQSIGGMPILTDDCQWRADVPFFCMGGYAGLQSSATRVSFNVLSSFVHRGEDAEWRSGVDEFGNKGVNWRAERAGNTGNVFDGLEEEVD
ncbi:hypothetical protein [Phaffia rhodozyma]|uniref:Uncharacterized protein n=1 Tax=Phaffia rhodozyma TaxID=264483 RepID=A0A0F7SLC8_PHARH|nr:hypothetical protein [Phaffia rhodozyma]